MGGKKGGARGSREEFTSALEIAYILELINLKMLGILRLLKIWKKLFTEQEENRNWQIMLKRIHKVGQQKYSRQQRDWHQT